jgi:hypothetical protein
MSSTGEEQERLSKSLSGAAGEYFVAAELCRHGFIAAITLKNSRGVDIIASRPGDKRAITVQVKTLQKGDKEWLLGKDDEIPKGRNHYYVFVALNGREGRPEYHIVEGDIVAKYCHDFHRDYLSKEKRGGGSRKDTSMRVFHPGTKFCGKWDALRLRE